MKRPTNNRELYDFLVALSLELGVRGAESLASTVHDASRQVVTFPNTEFLGESRIALRAVLASDEVLLSEAERAEIVDVVNQLNAAFDRMGRGA